MVNQLSYQWWQGPKNYIFQVEHPVKLITNDTIVLITGNSRRFHQIAVNSHSSSLDFTA